MKRMLAAMVVLISAPLSYAAAQVSPSTLLTYGPEVNPQLHGGDVRVVFQCLVGDGPGLVKCAPTTPPALDGAKLAELTDWVGATPACLLQGLAPGSTVYRDVLSLPNQTVRGAPHYAGPDWADRRAGMTLSYPRAAAQARVDGYVRLICDAAADGHAEYCVVQSEEPSGYDFGTAALQLSSSFRFRPETRDCVPIAGAKMVVPLRYHWPG